MPREDRHTASPSPAIRLSGASKVYATGVAALGPIDLAVRSGEFVALVGASGCGKSTLLRLVAGLLGPSSGTIAVDVPSGRDGPRVGFVFQEPNLMPWATVADNVALPLRLQRRGNAEASHRARAALARVGLGDFADRYPRELSGGMKMRVSLARALVTDPDILLMDEPFAALDELTRVQLNEDLRALWSGLGLTLLFVTHSVFEAVYLAERVVVMTPRPGRIAAECPIAADGVRDAGFRLSAAYIEQCRQVSEALARASGSEGLPASRAGLGPGGAA